MICPYCSSKTKIYNSRSTQSNSQTWRRHQCLKCSAAFTTREKIDWTASVRVLSDNHEAPYNRDRLLLSIARATHNLDLQAGAITDLTDTIELELQNTHFFDVDTQKADLITTLSMKVIARYDSNLALQYVNQVYRNKPPKELIKALLGA